MHPWTPSPFCSMQKFPYGQDVPYMRSGPPNATSSIPHSQQPSFLLPQASISTLQYVLSYSDYLNYVITPLLHFPYGLHQSSYATSGFTPAHQHKNSYKYKIAQTCRMILQADLQTFINGTATSETNLLLLFSVSRNGLLSSCRICR